MQNSLKVNHLSKIKNAFITYLKYSDMTILLRSMLTP